jgi:hypothetical protein
MQVGTLEIPVGRRLAGGPAQKAASNQDSIGITKRFFIYITLERGNHNYYPQNNQNPYKVQALL